MIELALIIMLILMCASGWIAYLYTMRLIRQRDEDRGRYRRALEFAEARANERIKLSEVEFDEKQDQVFAKGKQEGKRATLDWIKRQVDEGTLSVKVVGSPKK